MGSSSDLGIHLFGATGRIYGLLIRVRGYAYVVGAMQRGFFYRFGAKIFSPTTGYWESIFGLRTAIKSVDLMLGVGIRDEIIPVSFRCDWIHGSIHFSRVGSLSFVLSALDPEVFPKSKGENLEEFSTATIVSDNFYDPNTEEREQLDSY